MDGSRGVYDLSWMVGCAYFAIFVSVLFSGLISVHIV